MSPHNKGDDSIAVRVDCLDREEYVLTVLALHAIDSCIATELPIATPGVQVNGVASV